MTPESKAIYAGILVVVGVAAAGIVLLISEGEGPRDVLDTDAPGLTAAPQVTGSAADDQLVIVPDQRVRLDHGIPPKTPSKLVAACVAGDSEAMLRIVRETATADIALALGMARKSCTGWHQFRDCIAACASEDAPATAQWAAEYMNAGGDRAYALHVALWQWATMDPAAAAAWAASLLPEQGRSFALRTVITAWSRKDPAAAAEDLLEIEDLPSRHLLAGTLAYEWARTDLHRATAWAWNLPDGEERDSALGGLVRLLVDKGEIGSGTDRSIRAETLEGMVSVLGLPDENVVTRELVARVSESTPDPAFQLHLARWVKANPAEASAWAGQLADPRQRDYMLGAIRRVRDRIEGSSNDAAVPETPDPGDEPGPGQGIDAGADDNEAVEADVGEENDATDDGVVPGDPEPAEEDPVVAEDSAIAEVPEDVDELSWQELWDIVVQLPDGAMRDGLAHRAAVMQAESGEPEAALAMVTEHIPAGRLHDTTVRAVISGWVSNDTNSPVAWARSLPAGKSREQALFSLVLSLVDRHPQEAGNIALDLQPGTVTRRNAIVLVAFRWGRVSSGHATAWALQLKDPSERELALSKIN